MRLGLFAIFVVLAMLLACESDTGTHEEVENDAAIGNALADDCVTSNEYECVQGWCRCGNDPADQFTLSEEEAQTQCEFLVCPD